MARLPFSLSDQRVTSNRAIIRVKCPYCLSVKGYADESYAMKVDLAKARYYCFRCETEGSFKDAAEVFRDHVNPMPADIAGLKAMLARRPKGVKTFDLNLMTYPVHPAETPFAYNYLRSERGLTDEDIRRYHLRVGKPYFDAEQKRDVYSWSGRIIFPFMLGEDCIYMIGRSHTGKDPKYLNTAVQKGLVVYGIDDIGDSDRVIINEGFLSKHAASQATGVPAVAVLGKTPSPIQLSRIRTRCTTVFKSFDADLTERENRNLNLALFAMGFDVWDVKLPLELDPVTGLKKRKDPDDWKDRYREFFNRAKRATF